jgi:hypothetical protein
MVAAVVDRGAVSDGGDWRLVVQCQRWIFFGSEYQDVVAWEIRAKSK